jgi:uncharacterized membrane protein YiaA
MNKFKLYIFLIIFLKIIFIALSLMSIYLKHKKPANKKPENNKLIIQIDYWESRVEFIFTIMMSVLLIYLFNPIVNNLHLITYETKLSLYLFGFILLIKAKWSVFFEESTRFRRFQTVL